MFLALASLTSAYGAEVAVQAEFKPNFENPQFNTFTNTTQNDSYFCRHFPASCISRGITSISSPIRFRNSSPVTANHSDPRQGMMVRINSGWRTLTVTNTATLKTEEVRVRITGFGTVVYISPQTVHDLVPNATSWADGHTKLWEGGRLSGGTSTCPGQHASLFGASGMAMFWSTPISGATCSRKALFDIPNLAFQSTDFSYEIQTPNPLGMSTGNYQGSLTYSVGPNMDFDMGDNLLPDDASLTLNFTLNVQHALKIDIPPGGEKVELVPKGGWQQWLQKGRIPEKIYRDQPFLISSSTRFKMQLVCDREIGDTCAISNGSHEVPVDVLVSMPNGVAHDDNSAVSRKLLSVSTEQLFKSTFYVERKPSTLHFEIQKQYVEQMLTEQGKYSGNITVVWDSDI